MVARRYLGSYFSKRHEFKSLLSELGSSDYTAVLFLFYIIVPYGN